MAHQRPLITSSAALSIYSLEECQCVRTPSPYVHLYQNDVARSIPSYGERRARIASMHATPFLRPSQLQYLYVVVSEPTSHAPATIPPSPLSMPVPSLPLPVPLALSMMLIAVAPLSLLSLLCSLLFVAGDGPLPVAAAVSLLKASFAEPNC